MTAPPDEPRERSRLLTELSGSVLEQRYEIGRVLGAGGMGAVFEGRHLRLDRPVAIKVLRPGLAGHDEYVARFLREAKAASKIRHRNVVEILDYGEASGGLVYSVMELLVGQDLEQLLRAQPEERLPWARAYELLVQIASGLKAAHGQGVIHRDIKPANCFLTDEDGEPVVKLVDFGIAKLDEADQTHQLTATAQVLGTPSYIAPELVRTKSPASPRSDIYALGVLAYRMLSGRVPFTADTVFELLRRACFDPVPPLRELVPDLPPAVEDFVLQLLAKEPDQRPADMLAVRQRLVALSRETLGAQVVEIPSSSALPLDAETSGPTASGERTTQPRDGLRGGTARAERSPVAEPATVQLEGEPSRRSSEASTEVLLVPAGAPLQPIHDPSSLPSRSGETLPVVGDTSPHVERSTAAGPSPRRGGMQLVLAGAAALVVLGGAAALVLGDRGRGAPVEGSAAVAGMTPDATGPEARPAVEVTAKRVEDERPVPLASPQLGEVEASRPEPRVETSTGEAESSEGDASTGAPEASGDSAKDVVEVEKPAVPPPLTGRPATQKKSAKAPKPEDLPSDRSRIAELKKLVQERCARSLAGKSINLSFTVTPTGDVQDASADPSNEAGYCAVEQVKDMKFRPRDVNAPKRIVVD